MPQSYICSPCSQKFEGSDCVNQYYEHICPKSGFKPTDPRNLGPEFEAISKAALERGAASAPAGDTTSQTADGQYNVNLPASS